MNKAFFIQRMSLLSKLYGKHLDDDTISLYWSLFRGRGEAEFHAMVERLVGSFTPTAQVPFPVPAQFLQAVGEDAANQARAAVAAVIAAGHKVGPYKSVSFGDRALHSTILRFGGWPAVASWSAEDWRYNERKFLDAYTAEASSCASGPARLVGIYELENSRNDGRWDEARKAIAAKQAAVVSVEWRGNAGLLEDKTAPALSIEVQGIVDMVKSV